MNNEQGAPNLAELYDNAPGIIATTSGPKHVFTYANRAYRELVGRERLVGRPVADALPEVATQGFVDLLDDVFRTGEPHCAVKRPIWFQDKDGGGKRLCFVTFVYQAVRDEHGATSGLFLEGHDVTEECLAQQELNVLRNEVVHSARVNLMGTMAATLGHELNQPLSAIASYTGAGIRLLRSGQADDARLNDILSKIEAATQRAADIIHNIRKWTRRGESSRERFDLRDAIADSVAFVDAVGCADVPIDNRAIRKLDVVANRVEVEQVTVNLLRNACEASAPDRENRVSVDAWREHDVITVAVRDCGLGLPAAQAADVFDWSGSSKESGTGLGLAICRTIVEGHGGQIWVSSTGPEGTEFRFTLPVAPDTFDDSEGP